VPNGHDSQRVPWLPTDGPASDKHVFFIAFGFFLCGLLAIAHWSWYKNESAKSADQYRWHFLGGGRYNAVLGTLTLFTTIFSAVTIAGVPYEASRAGFFALRWCTSGVWIGIGAVLTIPRFYRLTKRRGYDCPNDFVSDRFNNRVLTITSSLLGAGSVFLYIIIQFYAISDLMPALSRVSDGSTVLDRNVTTWFLGAFIIVCEWFGGFDAVTWTDLLQSVVLLSAFVLLPCTYAYYYGKGAGAGDSFGYDCANHFVLNCTQQAFVDFGSPCASAATAAAFQTGCIAYNSNGLGSYLQMYPAGTETSEYFLPLTRVAQSGCPYEYNKSLPTCTPTVALQLGYFQQVPPAAWGSSAAPFPVPGPYAENRGWAQAPANSLLPSYTGADGVGTLSYTAPGMMSFNLLFFALALFPHWVMKAMSMNKESSVKIAYSVLSFATVWSVFPMILIGISGSALLSGIYPDAGTEFFAIILDNLANLGGGPEYISAIAAVGAIAAMMSTVDSALISVTNHLSTDFLRHWLMPDASDKTLLRACRGISFVSIVACISIALYDVKLNNDTNIYSVLISWQSSLLWQILPVSMIALYWDLNAWACIAGQVCGVAAILGFYIHEDSCHNWNTAYAWKKDSYLYNNVLNGDNHPEECDVNTYYLAYHVWAAVINVFVTTVLSILFGMLSMGNSTESLTMPHVSKTFGSGDGGELTTARINKYMHEGENTREPAKDPLSVACIFVAVLLTTLSLPWYGNAYDDCDYDSYLRWQACEVAGVDCKAMCDVADMSLAPPLPIPALITAASACLTSSTTCTCPTQGGYFTFTAGPAMIPTDPVANVSFSESVASLSAGGGVVFQGSGNGKVCEGYELTDGIPSWAMVVIGCWIASLFFLVTAWLRWGCDDTLPYKNHAEKTEDIILNAAGGLSETEHGVARSGKMSMTVL